MHCFFDGKEHKGFQQISAPQDAPPNCKIVLAWFDGEPDLWAIEGDAGLEALKKYYSDEWGTDRVTYQIAVRDSK